MGQCQITNSALLPNHYCDVTIHAQIQSLQPSSMLCCQASPTQIPVKRQSCVAVIAVMSKV